MSGRFVDAAPWPPGPDAVEESAEARRWGAATPRQIFRRRFLKHRLAVIGAAVLALMYLMCLVVEVLAPYPLDRRDSGLILAPPQTVSIWRDGGLAAPYVLGYDYRLDLETLQRIYTPDPAKAQPLRFFCAGEPVRFWGLVETRLRLVCPAEGGSLHLLGTDRLGRDVLSRLLYGMRISLTIGLIGVAISLALGVIIGGLAGYYGGWFDAVTQRTIEVLRSFPELPLWMALSAALPVDWSPILVYFGITLILGLLDWTGLARAVRSKFLALREEDYVLAAETMGASTTRVVRRHLVPGFTSHLIASATLAIPGMILGETALSFLGLGLRPPITSWGVMLAEAQSIEAVVLHPWLLAPVIPVVLTVLAFNFMGDGLRDAADPHSPI